LLSNEDKEKGIEDYVGIETAVARKRLEEAETPIKQEQDDMRNAEKAGLSTTKAEISVEEMLNAIRECMSYRASSDIGQDWPDEDDDEEDPAGGMPSNDDELCGVMGTISKSVQYRIERFPQKKMKLDEWWQPG